MSDQPRLWEPEPEPAPPAHTTPAAPHEPAPATLPPTCDYNFIEHPDQWRSDIDLTEPVHLLTCRRCAYIRDHPEEFPSTPHTPAGHAELTHDALRLAAAVAWDEGLQQEAQALDTAWEAGDDRRRARIHEAQVAGERLPGADTTIDLLAELAARGWGAAVRRYARDRKVMV